MAERTRWCDFPPLVTTCTDGDNGGWFRNVSPGANFWDAFYVLMLERARSDDQAPRPVFIHDYLDRHGVHGDEGTYRCLEHRLASRPRIHPVDWLAAHKISQEFHNLCQRAGELERQEPEIQALLEQALWRLLRAETSCNFFWGEAWVEAEHDLEAARESLKAAARYLGQE